LTDKCSPRSIDNRQGWRQAATISAFLRRSFLSTGTFLRRAVLVSIEKTKQGFAILGDFVNQQPRVTGLLCLLLLVALVASFFTSQERIYLASNVEARCLALNIYHEARGEPFEGKLAVGHVVLNRVTDRSFPDSICEVVKDGQEHKRNKCQFSWWCDGRSDKADDGSAWRESLEIAGRIMSGRSEDPTDGALWYHAETVEPAWRRDFISVGQIGRHIFYQRSQNANAAGKDS
jgi:hypothetical protein